LGMKGSVVQLSDISAVRVAEPQARMTRAAAQTRPDRRSIAKLWSVLGVKTGIEIDIRSEDDKITTWFIASNDAETLCEKLGVAIGGADDVASDSEQE